MRFFKEMKQLYFCFGWEKNENLTAHQRIFRLYQCQSNIFSTFLSKITKYNRVPLGFDPSVARLLGHDPTPRPTCPVVLDCNVTVFGRHISAAQYFEY